MYHGICREKCSTPKKNSRTTKISLRLIARLFIKGAEAMRSNKTGKTFWKCGSKSASSSPDTRFVLNGVKSGRPNWPHWDYFTPKKNGVMTTLVVTGDGAHLPFSSWTVEHSLKIGGMLMWEPKKSTVMVWISKAFGHIWGKWEKHQNEHEGFLHVKLQGHKHRIHRFRKDSFRESSKGIPAYPRVCELISIFQVYRYQKKPCWILPRGSILRGNLWSIPFPNHGNFPTFRLPTSQVVLESLLPTTWRGSFQQAKFPLISSWWTVTTSRSPIISSAFHHP